MKKFSDLNRLVKELKKYIKNDNKCSISIIHDAFLSMPMGGIKVNFKNIVLIAEGLKLITYDNDVIELLENGEKLYQIQPNNSYDLSVDQKEFLSFLYLEYKKELVFFLFRNSNSIEGNLLIFRKDFPPIIKSFSDDLKYLNVLKEKDEFSLYVEKKIWSKFIKTPLTKQDLEEINRKKGIAGRNAEEFAYFFEAYRLKEQGINNAYKKIIHLGESDVTAGFDIKSINGETHIPLVKREIFFDRFIEVKNVSNGIFYLSENEIDKAISLHNNYWLYLVDFRLKKIYLIPNSFKFFKSIGVEGKPTGLSFVFNPISSKI